MAPNECACGRLFRFAEDYRDHLPCTAADTARVRAHPEYQAMLENLSNTQARCTVLLEGLRAVKKDLADEGYRVEDDILYKVNRAINPPA